MGKKLICGIFQCVPWNPIKFCAVMTDLMTGEMISWSNKVGPLSKVKQIFSLYFPLLLSLSFSHLLLFLALSLINIRPLGGLEHWESLFVLGSGVKSVAGSMTRLRNAPLGFWAGYGDGRPESQQIFLSVQQSGLAHLGFPHCSTQEASGFSSYTSLISHSVLWPGCPLLSPPSSFQPKLSLPSGCHDSQGDLKRGGPSGLS